MILRMKRYFGYTGLFLLLGLLLICCNNITGEEDLQEIEAMDLNARYGDRDFNVPVLSPRAQKAVAKWSPFEDFEIEVRGLNHNTISDLRNKTERLQVHTDSLAKKIPNDLFSNPIYSRLIVVSSRVHLLHQAVRKDRADSLQIQNYLTEFNNAAKNLFLQINEKFQKDEIDEQRKDDEQKELEKQKRFIDSVYRAELRDKNN